MKHLTILFCLFFGMSVSVFARQDRNNEDFQYTSEFSVGLNLSSIGGIFGGGTLRYSRQTANPRMYHNYSLEIVQVKHPKEKRSASRITGTAFVPGKQNSLIFLRPQYGREYILFRKADDQGVRVSAIGAIGPTIAWVFPYMIRYRYNSGIEREEQYDPALHTSFDQVVRVVGPAERFAQSTFAWGASAKASAVFEFGSFRNNVFGCEIGGMLDFMGSELVILPLAENKSTYGSVFVTIFYGGRN